VSEHAVVSDPDAAFDYITAQYPLGRTADWKGIVQLRNDEIIGAVGYDQYNGANIFMHVASDGTSRWGTRHFLHEVFKYPFKTLGVGRVTVWVEGNNVRSRRLVTNLGFTAEAVLSRAGRDGVDVLIYRMFRQECRYA
jgi:RimJ/RimL family protein N-acetyltransferase